jgi:hypothetical protein
MANNGSRLFVQMLNPTIYFRKIKEKNINNFQIIHGLGPNKSRCAAMRAQHDGSPVCHPVCVGILTFPFFKTTCPQVVWSSYEHGVEGRPHCDQFYQDLKLSTLFKDLPRHDAIKK